MNEKKEKKKKKKGGIQMKMLTSSTPRSAQHAMKKGKLDKYH